MPSTSSSTSFQRGPGIGSGQSAQRDGERTGMKRPMPRIRELDHCLLLATVTASTDQALVVAEHSMRSAARLCPEIFRSTTCTMEVRYCDLAGSVSGGPRRAAHAPWQRPRPNPLGHRTHVGVVASVSAARRPLRTSPLRPRGDATKSTRAPRARPVPAAQPHASAGLLRSRSGR